ncbi:pyridoxamine 5'-phosphate oxidase family protein [Rhodococcus tukisamuensis]|uniref:PPOX class probable F420-dependent enzyme, Rv3369 family n=1 Tax=Rhodococcus tukisamuensis TaxID=168276 RepID=A0A1G6Y516_9NOCA|nr:pyridoxamine 5'-phosphate oxidase family protein [Rhodococcus tukisamuensis]SDD84787.1 PPOX class probable F420-dependent enzyme, Rv3369 family [Rhodococcus tukisamuensis]
MTDSGVPSPNPVWFVPDGDDLVVFTAPESRKVQNVRQRPTVTLNFNSDPPGGDIVVIKGTVSATPNVKASGLPGYLDKYETAITGELGTTVAEIDRIYSTELRITPTRVRLTPG